MKTCPACKKQFDDASEFCPDDGGALEHDMSALVGTTLDGQYHIEAMLGQGGMGAVFLARHTLLGDRVAIKIMPPHIRSNPEYKRRFLREGQAARSFKHPNAVTVYDLRTTSEGMIYMALEYIEGRTLRAEMEERKRFSAVEVLELIEPIADALNEAHKAGIVHRDLKPENIMVSRSSDGKPMVKLLDLGIAKIQSVSNASIAVPTALTKIDQVVGTPYYMSPEQWGLSDEADKSTIDGRADIYSLGIVLYEMMTGQRPFNAKTYNELAVAHATVIPPLAHEVCPDVPEAFSQAISRAIAKERSRRQAACKELVGELRASLEAAIPAKPPSKEVSNSTLQTDRLPTLPAPAGAKTKYLLSHAGLKTPSFSWLL